MQHPPETIKTLPTADTPETDAHKLARGAASNALVLLAANFRGVFTFLIARILGSAALGRFGLMFAATDLLSKPGMLGFDSGIVPLLAQRSAAGDGEGARALYGRALGVALVASAVLAIVAIPLLNAVASTRGNGAFAGSSTLMLLALPGIALSRISTGASRSRLAMRNEFYSRGVTETWVTTATFVVAIAIGLRSAAPALAVVAGSTAGGLVAFALASRALRSIRGSSEHDRPPLGAMLRFTLPIAGTDLLDVLVLQADVLLLSLYVGHAPGVTVERFGIFCAAAEIAGGMRKVRQVFDPIFAPLVAARAVSENRAALVETVAAPGRWVLSAQLPLVGGLLLASGAVMSIYGPGFREGALWLALLGLAHGTNSFAGIVATLFMVERPSLNLINEAVTVVVQLVSGVILIPLFGVTGAALAMLAGFATQGALRFAEVRRVFGWSWPWRALKRPVAAFAVAIVPATLLRLVGGLLAEIAAALLFFALYLGAWRVFGADPADREVWRQLTARLRGGSRIAAVE